MVLRGDFPRPHSGSFEEAANLDDLILRQVASPDRAERDGLTFHGHSPIAPVCLVNFSETSEQRTDIDPLNVVIKRVSEQLLGGDAVMVIQLERHSQPPSAGPNRFRPRLHFLPSRL